MNNDKKRNNEKEKEEQEDEIYHENSLSNVGNQTLDSIVSVSQSHNAKNKSLMSSLILMLKKPFHLSSHKYKKPSKSKKNQSNNTKKPINSQSSINHTPSHIIVQDNSILHHNFSKTSNIKPNTDNFIMDLQSDIDLTHTTSEHQLKPKISLEIKQKKSQRKNNHKSKKGHLYQKFNVKKIFKKKKPTVFSSVEIIDVEPLTTQENKNDALKVTSPALSDEIKTIKSERKENIININNNVSTSYNVQPSMDISVPNAIIESSYNTTNGEGQLISTVNTPTDTSHKNETDPSGFCMSQNKVYSFGNISELPLISGIDPTDSLPTLVEEDTLPSSTTPTKDQIVNFDSMASEPGAVEDVEQIYSENKTEEMKENKLSYVESLNNKSSSLNGNTSQVQQDTSSSCNTSSIPELSSEPNISGIQVDNIHISQTSLQSKDEIQQLFENSEISRTPTPIDTMNSIDPCITTTSNTENRVIINSSTTTDDIPEDEIRIYCGLPDKTLKTTQSVVEKVTQYFADNIACFWSIFPLNEQHQRMGNWKLGEFIDRWFRSGCEDCVKEISRMVSTQDQFLIERLLKFQLKSCSWTSHNNFLQYNLIRLCMEKDDEQHVNVLLRFFIYPPHLWSRVAYFMAELLEFASGIYPDYDVIVSELTDSYDLVHRMNPIQLCLTAIYMGTNIVPKHKRPTIFRSSINEEIYDHEYTLLELMCCLVIENCMKKYCETEIIKYLMRVYAPIVLSITDSKTYSMNVGESKDISTSLIPNYNNTGGIDTIGTISQSRLNNSDSLQFNLNLMKQHLYQSDTSSAVMNNNSINKININESTDSGNNRVAKNETKPNTSNINTNNISDVNINVLNQSHNMSNNLYYNNLYYNNDNIMNQTLSTFESSYGGTSGNPIGIPMYLLHEQNSFDISNHCIDMDGQSNPDDNNSTFTHPSLLLKEDFEVETFSSKTNDPLSQSISTTSLTQSSYPSESKKEQFNKNAINFYLQKRNEFIKVDLSTSETPEVQEKKKPMVLTEKKLSITDTDDEKTPVVEVKKRTPELESDDQKTPTINAPEKGSVHDYVSFNTRLEGLMEEKMHPMINNNEMVTVATPASIELLNESAFQEINANKAHKGKGEISKCQNDVNDYKIEKENNSKKIMETIDHCRPLNVDPLELVELDKLTKATQEMTIGENINKTQYSIQQEDDYDHENDNNQDISTSYSERQSFRIKDSLSLSSEYSGLRRCTQSINTINTTSLSSSRHTLSRTDSKDQLHQYLSRHSVNLYEDMEKINSDNESDFDRNTHYTSLGVMNRPHRPPSEAISSFELSSQCPSFYSYSFKAGKKGKEPMSSTTSMLSSSSSSYDDDENDVEHEYSFVSMLSSKPSLSMKSVLDSTNSKVILHEFGSTHTNTHGAPSKAQGGMVGSISSKKDFQPDQSTSSAYIKISSSTLPSQSKEQSHLIVDPSISSLCLGEPQTNDSIPSTSQPKISANNSDQIKIPNARTSSLATPSTSVVSTNHTINHNQMTDSLVNKMLMSSESSILSILRNNNYENNRRIRMEALHDIIEHLNPHLSEKWIRALELVDDYQHHPSLQDTFTNYTMEHLNELEAILRIFHLYDVKEIQNDVLKWVDSLIAKN